MNLEGMEKEVAHEEELKVNNVESSKTLNSEEISASEEIEIELSQENEEPKIEFPDLKIEDLEAMEKEVAQDEELFGKMDDPEAMQIFLEGLESSYNGLILKAKLIIASESPIEVIEQEHYVTPNDAKLIQNFAIARLTQIEMIDELLRRQDMVNYLRELKEQAMKENNETVSLF